MCENNERYDCKTAIWIKKNGQNSKTENFSVSISRALIKYQSSQVKARIEKSGNFRLIENYTRLIEILEN